MAPKKNKFDIDAKIQALRNDFAAQFQELSDLVLSRTMPVHSLHSEPESTVDPPTMAAISASASAGPPLITSTEPIVTERIPASGAHIERGEIQSVYAVSSILQHLQGYTILDEASRYQARRTTMAAMQRKPFRLLVEQLRFRTFLQQFVFDFNAAKADTRDAAVIFASAIDEECLAYLRMLEADFSDLTTLVQLLAERCQLLLPDFLVLLDQFSSERMGVRSCDRYYYALLEYHNNPPEAITKLQV